MNLGSVFGGIRNLFGGDRASEGASGAVAQALEARPEEMAIPSIGELLGSGSSEPAPGSRRLALEVKFAKARLAGQEERRSIDKATAPFVLKDIEAREKASADRTEGLMTKLQDVEAILAGQQAPRRESGGLSQGEVMASGLVGTFAPNQFNRVVGALTEASKARDEAEFQQKLAQFGLTRETAADQLEDLRRQLLGERSTQQPLGDATLDAWQMKAQQDAADAKALALEGRQREAQEKDLRARFAGSGDAGETRYFARLLEGTDSAVTPGEVESKIRALGEKALKEYNARVESLWKSSSAVSAADGANLSAMRQAIMDEYGLPANRFAEVPTSETLGKARMDQQKTMHDESLRLARQKFSWVTDVQHRDQMAVRWAQVDVARQNALSAQVRTDYAGMRLYVDQFDQGSGELAGKAQQKVVALNAKLAGLTSRRNAAWDNENRKVRKGQQKEYDKAQAEIAQTKGERDRWLAEVERLNTERSGLGLGPVELMEDAAGFAAGQRGGNAPYVPSGLAGGIPRGPVSDGRQRVADAPKKGAGQFPKGWGG